MMSEISLLLSNFQVLYTLYNRMTISSYHTKPVRGDCAILFLKLHGFT